MGEAIFQTVVAHDFSFECRGGMGFRGGAVDVLQQSGCVGLTLV